MFYIELDYQKVIWK